MAQAETIPTTSRRSFLAGVTAAAVLPAVAAPQPIDPIFAVIERCRLADKNYTAAAISNDEVAAEKQGRSITRTDEDFLEAAADELDDAVGLLTSTAPTTMAGLAAAVTWLLEYDEGCIPDTSGRFLRTLAQSGFLNT